MTQPAVRPSETMPTLALQNIERVQLLCLVAPATRADSRALEQELCEQAVALARQGAKVPVELLAFGDPKLLDRSSLTLLIHAGVQSDRDGRLVALYVRPFRGGGPDTETFFVSPPRAARIAESGPGGAPLREALAASLADILPWPR